MFKDSHSLSTIMEAIYKLAENRDAAAEDDLPQTQSQTYAVDEHQFSQNEDDGKDIWGRLVGKNHSFHDVGTYTVCWFTRRF